MNPTKAFDLSRVGLLIKKELFYQRKAPWIIIGGVFVFLLFLNLLMSSENPGPNDLPANQLFFYVSTLLILGTIFTSSAFTELNSKSSAHHYLSIPASSLEKIVSKWLVTGIFYVIAFNIFYFIFCIISSALTHYFFDQTFLVFNPLEPRFELNAWRPILFSQLYLSLHTVYLAGSVYFRKYAYFKTMIAQSFILLSLIGLIMCIASLFFADVWMNGINLAHIDIGDGTKNLVENILPVIGKIMLWFVFPLWMLTYSYFKLKETEI